MDHLLLFIVLALLAEILGTVGGFGSSLFFVPIAGYFLDFHTVLGVTAVFHVSSNVSKLFLFRDGFDKRLLLRMGIPAVILVVLGAWMSKFFDARWLELILSLFLIVLSLYFLFRPTFTLKANTSNAVGGGILSGFAAGLLGTGGAIRGVALSAFALSKSVFIATSAWIDLGIDGSRAIVYYFNGYILKENLYLVPILLGVSLCGSWMGKLVLQQISETLFRKIVLLLILLTGLVTLGRSIYLNGL